MSSLHRFATQEALVQALTEFCLARLNASLAEYHNVTLLLSGGSTPAPLYRRLGAQALPWERLHLALVDERWVPPSDPASNEKLLRETLGAHAAARLQGIYEGSATPRQALLEVNRRYAALPRPWALGLLGLGPDGHTASLFPAAQGLEQALATEQLCAALDAKPSAVTGTHTARLSLSLSALLSIDHLVLLFTGAAKWKVYQEALRNPAPATTPVSYLLQQTSVPLAIFWCP
ncbi:MAG TPA: 6-phosphogluconolactonase [Hyphomicrobiales bacterium]|nr:6-phosphogluconolactonase [Hyphomicrobiales bacterium]